MRSQTHADRPGNVLPMEGRSWLRKLKNQLRVLRRIYPERLTQMFYIAIALAAAIVWLVNLRR